MNQFMANLPAARINPSERPFTNAAVDYTGAFLVKLSNGRGFKSHKSYVAIFVCMATRAMHIELVSDLTADAFIAAYRRMVSRRGAIRNLYSDNGTNFIKSNKILVENMQNMNERMTLPSVMSFQNLEHDGIFRLRVLLILTALPKQR